MLKEPLFGGVTYQEDEEEGRGSSLRREIYENEATNMKAYKDRNLKVKNEDDVFLFKGGMKCSVTNSRNSIHIKPIILEGTSINYIF